MNKKTYLIALLLISIVSLVVAPLFGGSTLDFAAISSFDNESPDYQIFFNIRLPRVILAFLAGAALSVCGMCFQSMFRNDLATPFTLGIASGASFGVVFYIFLGGPVLFAAFLSGNSLAAFCGAILALTIIYLSLIHI